MWKFIIPKVPWLGGKFEPLISLIKANLYISVGKAQLKWAELEEVLPNIEMILNNRSISYIEEDFLILTSNTLILERDVNFPNNAASHESQSEARKK